jgi:lipoyl(octanoyl) transferase
VTTRWRLLHTQPLDGIDNMALDHALLARAARTGESVLRVYAWRSPTVSFGRHQRTAGVYDPCRLATLGLACVRRPTGGRAVLHAREATYSVTAPVTGPLRVTYAAINRLLLDALRRLGVPATLAPPVRAPRPNGAPCFDVATEGEITIAGRKLAGSAQWRDGGAFLQHGSILIEDDQHLLARIAATPASPHSPPTTLHVALGRAPTIDEVAHALFAAAASLYADASPWEPSLDAAVSPLSLDAVLSHDDALRADLGALRARYSDEHWTWRA